MGKNWKNRGNREKMGKQENKRKWKIREKKGKIGGYLTKGDKPYEIKGQT